MGPYFHNTEEFCIAYSTFYNTFIQGSQPQSPAWYSPQITTNLQAPEISSPGINSNFGDKRHTIA